MNTKHSTTPEELNAIISRLADYLLTHRIDNQFRELAREEARQISIAQLDQLRKMFHDPPPQSDVYDVKQHGLGGWLSACQFAIFELIFNLGEDALPFIREIAWGEYDWTQGNAIELLLRMAAEGIRTEEILAEIKANYPQIRFESQLYGIQPLLPELDQNSQLKAIFDELRSEVEEFQRAYAEFTDEAQPTIPSTDFDSLLLAMIIIQHISTFWTKKSRGMPAAEKRNAVPHRLLLPEAPRPLPPVFVHEIIALEGNDFQLKQTSLLPASEEQYWSFQFQQQADQLEVVFTYSWTEHGAPDRGSYTRPLFSLKLNQTGAFSINGRFSSYDAQYYAAHSVNLGYVDRFHDNLFLTQTPEHSIDLRAQLF